MDRKGENPTPEEAVIGFTQAGAHGQQREVRRPGVAYRVVVTKPSFAPEPETPEQRAARITDARARFRQQTHQREF